jgi:predicted DNA-binding ribbon-helix-helix protein
LEEDVCNAFLAKYYLTRETSKNLQSILRVLLEIYIYQQVESEIFLYLSNIEEQAVVTAILLLLESYRGNYNRKVNLSAGERVSASDPLLPPKSMRPVCM